MPYPYHAQKSLALFSGRIVLEPQPLKAWLYHRGQWQEIDDPVDDQKGWLAVESAEENARGKRTLFLQKYGYKSHEGPTLRNKADSRKLDKCGTVSGKTRIALTINQHVTIIGDSEAASVI